MTMISAEGGLSPDSLATSHVDENPPFFVHIHIPKTGGTTFNSVLERNLKDRYDPFQGRWIAHFPKLTARQVKDYAETQPGIIASSSHKFSLDLPYSDCRRPIIPIALIRNPIDRFLSFYFHVRFRPWSKHIAKELFLDNFIDYVIKNMSGDFVDSHLLYLLPNENEENYLKVADMVEREILHLIPTSHMQRGLCKLRSEFPLFFEDIRFNIENKSTRDQEVTDAHREKIGSICPPYCWRLLKLAHTCTET